MNEQLFQWKQKWEKLKKELLKSHILYIYMKFEKIKPRMNIQPVPTKYVIRQLLTIILNEMISLKKCLFV